MALILIGGGIMLYGLSVFLTAWIIEKFAKPGLWRMLVLLPVYVLSTALVWIPIGLLLALIFPEGNAGALLLLFALSGPGHGGMAAMLRSFQQS